MRSFWHGFEKKARENVLDYAKLFAKKPLPPGPVINYASGTPVVSLSQKALVSKLPRVSKAQVAKNRVANALKNSAPKSAWEEALSK